MNISSEDLLMIKLSCTPIRNKNDVKIGDRVKVLYKGWNIVRDKSITGCMSNIIKKEKIERIIDATIIDQNAGLKISNPKWYHEELAIILDDDTENYSDGRKSCSGELKNFKNGWDGTRGVGASWGGTGVGSSFLTSGCKIIGKIGV